LRRRRLLPADADPVVGRVHPAGEAVRPARPGRVPQGLAGRSDVLLRRLADRATHVLADAEAGDGAVRLGGERGLTGGGAVAAVLAAIPGDRAAGRPGTVLGPPPVPRGAVAVEVSRGPPLDGSVGLDVRLPAALRGPGGVAGG